MDQKSNIMERSLWAKLDFHEENVYINVQIIQYK